MIVAVNKMDLVDYSQDVYKKIQADYLDMAGSLDIPDVRFVPISALKGDNVVNESEHLSWFRGSTLMQYLENIEVDREVISSEFRFPVQYVNRPNSNFRGFAGTVASGKVKVGDAIRVLPSGTVSTVKEIVTFDGNLDSAGASQAVTLTLNDEIDVSRGDMIVKKDELANVSSRLRAKVVWMNEKPLETHREYYLKFNSKLTTGSVTDIQHRIDVNTFKEHKAGKLELNEIGLVDIQANEKIMFDDYQSNPGTGAFIIIDRMTNMTVGAGMITEPLADDGEAEVPEQYSQFELELNALIRKHFPHWDAKDLRKL